MKLRIKFSKYGPMIYIGHLDMMRYFQKAMRRANVDISYTTGFSPHQIMSFAQPLGVGIYSNGEYFDIGVDRLTSSKQVKDALNAVMVDGVRILSVKLLPDKAQNAMSSVAAAAYTIAFRDGHAPDFDLFGQIDSYMAQDVIPAVKETKKGSHTFDLKESVYDLTYDRDRQTVSMLVNASSAGNIKPAFVMQSLYAFCGRALGEFDLIITREDTYALSGKGAPQRFCPLDAVGEDY